MVCRSNECRGYAGSFFLTPYSVTELRLLCRHLSTMAFMGSKLALVRGLNGLRKDELVERMLQCLQLQPFRRQKKKPESDPAALSALVEFTTDWLRQAEIIQQDRALEHQERLRAAQLQAEEWHKAWKAAAAAAYFNCSNSNRQPEQDDSSKEDAVGRTVLVFQKRNGIIKKKEGTEQESLSTQSNKKAVTVGIEQSKLVREKQATMTDESNNKQIQEKQITAASQQNHHPPYPPPPHWVPQFYPPFYYGYPPPHHYMPYPPPRQLHSSHGRSNRHISSNKSDDDEEGNSSSKRPADEPVLTPPPKLQRLTSHTRVSSCTRSKR